MKIAVFSGTSDGRELCGFLAANGHDVSVYVATEYGASLMSGITVHVGRLNAAEMAVAVLSYDVVIDATHPYAAEATRNIRAACEKANIKYLRLAREETEYEGCISVLDAGAAAEYLKNTSGRIFVTTGSKELAAFEPVGDRVTARVLDTAAVREKCAGMAIDCIMYKMPPYSYEDNLKDFKSSGYLVTKDSGTAGGTSEKLSAAKALGMTVVMIERPDTGRGGYSLAELKTMLKKD
ncbi:MAG: precorrin-6A reductase [Oscillospiraceae bacterium]|nr:precorrin-6A reductase [Oscillospiraceae bacterium]